MGEGTGWGWVWGEDDAIGSLNEITPQFVLTEEDWGGNWGFRKCGAENIPPVVARGVLIDVARALGVEMLPDSYGIGADDLKAALDRQGSKILPGDVVIIRTGRMTVWPEFDAYLVNEPGLNLEGAKLLAEAGAMLVGGDNVGVEQLPSAIPDDWIPVHSYLLAECGVAIMEGDRLVGLFTERDLLRRVLLQNLNVDKVQVSEVMTKELVTATPDDDAQTAGRLMRQHHIRHLPVVNEDTLVGILSIRNLIREEVQELRDYIAQRDG